MVTSKYGQNESIGGQHGSKDGQRESKGGQHEFRILCIRIDIRMIPSKVVHFLYCSAFGSIIPYLNIFLISIGLTVAEAGFISGISCLSVIFSPPLWGLLADVTGKRKRIIIILSLGSTIFVFCLPWVARYFHCPHHHHPYHTEITHPSYRLNKTLINLHADAGSFSHNLQSDVNPYEKQRGNRPFCNPTFYAMLLFIFVAKGFLTSLLSFIDSTIMDIIEFTGTGASFGEQRMFGSVGVGMASVVAGVAVDSYNHPPMSKYTALFFVFLPCILLTIPFLILQHRHTSWQNNTEQKDGEAIVEMDVPDIKSGYSRVETLMIIFGDLDNFIIMVSILICGILRKIAIPFLFLLMKSEMHATAVAMGTAELVGDVSQAVVFCFTRKLIDKLGGLIVSMEIAILSWCVMLITTSYIQHEWMALIPQVLQGFSVSLFSAAYIEYAAKISSKQVYVTMFGIIASLYRGVGGLIGESVGGMAYGYLKGPTLFRYTAMFGLTWLLVMVLYFHISSFIKSFLETFGAPPQKGYSPLSSKE